MGIRIESKLEHDLNVPLEAQPGRKPVHLLIPGKKDGKVGVLETEFIDAVSLARLRWHYDRRPVDPGARTVHEDGTSTIDESVPHLEIGLLKITITDEDVAARPRRVAEAAPVASLHGQPTPDDLAPPRRQNTAAPKAASPKPSSARKPRARKVA